MVFVYAVCFPRDGGRIALTYWYKNHSLLRDTNAARSRVRCCTAEQQRYLLYCRVADEAGLLAQPLQLAQSPHAEALSSRRCNS
jgi:hypothetical protein